MEDKNLLLMLLILLVYLFIIAKDDNSIIDRLQDNLPKIIYFTSLMLLVGLVGNEEFVFYFLILVLSGSLILNGDKFASFLKGLNI